ncbi:hypothetical protein L195_g024222 [Trifolium pratense]|uniref:Uncharacterized protein n=1 Tax=Trifolium pratense TaxID=57577 RepID=A0A2K3ND40_TRIPR|nr:hypothetical protein L195_g024222 [Trifolium pratense]
MVVADQMQQSERKWNVDLVNQVFNQRDAVEIIKIPTLPCHIMRIHQYDGSTKMATTQFDLHIANSWRLYSSQRQEVWKQTHVYMWEQLERYVLEALGYVALIFTLLEKLDSMMMAAIAMVLWTGWWQRNQKCWNNNFPPTFEVRKGRNGQDHIKEW